MNGTKKIIATMTLATVLASGQVIPAFASSLENPETDAQTQQLIPQGTQSNIQSKKVMVSDVRVDANVEPGKPFTVTLRLENISDSAIHGLSFKLVNVEGKATLDPFMPVGTTNEVYVGTIGYQDVRDVSITLQSSPGIADGVYNFLTSIMFHSPGGSEEEITKTIGVMVKNTSVVSVSQLLDTNGVLTGTITNEGKNRLQNVRVSAKVGDQVIEQDLGTISSEAEGYIELTLPNVSTDLKVPVTITYEDATGTVQTKETTVTVLAVNQETPTLDENGSPQPAEQSWWQKFMSFLGFGE